MIVSFKKNNDEEHGPTFVDVDEGQFFVWGSRLYQKIDNSYQQGNFNCVIIAADGIPSGELDRFPLEDEVDEILNITDIEY